MRKDLISAALVAAAVAFLAAGCRDEEPTARLMLFCGAGIKPAADALIEAFEADNPGVEIDPTYAGSGRLLGQMSANAVGDLFMPGAELYVDKAVELGLADASTKRVVAYFVPVVFVRKGFDKVESLADLAKPGVRVGLGDERACAVGKVALKILAKNGMDPKKMNVVFKSGTVNELPLAVQLGNVDAVICWDANARQFAEAGRMVEIPPAKNVIATIPIVLLKSSRHAQAAMKFIDFVTSEKGKRLLTENYYTVSLSRE